MATNAPPYSLAAGDSALVYPLSAIIDHVSNLSQTSLTVLPSTALFHIAPIFYFGYRNQAAVVASGSLLWAKLCVAAALACTETVSLVSWTYVRTDNFSPIFAAAFSCLASLCLVGIINIEHRYTTRSTATLAIWLSITLILDLQRICSCLLPVPELHRVAVSAIFTLGFKLALLALNEMPKSPSFTKVRPGKHLCPKDTSGFWSRSLFLWFTRSLAFGFSNQPENPYSGPFSTDLSVDEFSGRFTERWATPQTLTPHRLLYAMVRALSLPLMCFAIPRLLFIIFNLSQVTYIRHFIISIDGGLHSCYDKACLIAAAAFIHFGLTLSKTVFKNLSSSIIMVIRETLASAVYSRLLTLPFSDAQKSGVTTTMNDNIEGFATNLMNFYNLAVDAIEIVVCVQWLVVLIGPTTLLVISPSVFYVAMTWYISKRMPCSREDLVKSSELRMARTSNIMSHIKSIQMVGLTSVVSTLLYRLRRKEVENAVKSSHCSTVVVASATVLLAVPGPAIISSLLSASKVGRLIPQDTYPSLLINFLLYEAMRKIVSIHAIGNACLMSASRVQDFLLLDDIQIVATNAATARAAGNTVGRNESQVAVAHNSATQLPVNGAILLQNVSICASWTNQGPSLDNVNVHVQQNELVMVAGPTGCGKSTFVRFLVGDGVRRSGVFLKKPGKAGYCDQRPWLQHASIRDNIIGPLKFDEPWYNTVVEACLLPADFKQLTLADGTVVENNNSNLSNGQIHRIALARAVYMQASYLILDNVFSALDSGTATEIFSRLFGTDGIVKRKSCTIILTTHSRAFLKKANRVIFIDSVGDVSMHTDLNSSEFWTRLNSLGISETDTALDQDENFAVSQNVALASQLMHKYKREDDTYRKLLWAYISCFPRSWFIMWSCFLSVAAVGVAIPEAFVHIWVVAAPENKRYLTGYLWISVGSCVFIVLAFCLWSTKLVPSFANAIHTRIIKRLFNAKISFFTASTHDTFMLFLGPEINTISQALPFSFVRVVYVATLSTIHLCILAAVTRRWSVVIVPSIYGIYTALVYYFQVSRQLRCENTAAKAALSTHMSETVIGLRHIRAFGWASRKLRESNTTLRQSQRLFFNVLSIERWLHLMLDFTKGASILSLVLLAILRPTSISASSVALCLILITTCSDGLAYLAEDCTMVGDCLDAFARFNNFVKSIPREMDTPLPRRMMPRAWPAEGRVMLSGVSAKYISDASDALKDVSLNIPPGHKVAIVGRSGSGKSSVLLALLNFLEHTGTIELDGINVRAFSPRELRARITTISQDVIDMGGTVRFNLCPWTMIISETKGNVHPKAIYEVLKALKLWDVIKANGGLDALVSSLGLSDGQMQLLSIARGMLHNLLSGGNVVLMDETVSGMDAGTAKTVRDALVDVFPDRTVIAVVNEDNNPLKEVDLTIRMSEGRAIRKIVNSNGPAARKRAAEKQAAGSQVAVPPPPPPPQPIHPHYQRLMDLQTNPDAPPLESPHRESEVRLRAAYARRGRGRGLL